ncbi:MAG TPA: mechanosensitive ion channel domain-containing protein [Blastocatellia bacterium]|nr:mechanosensitive ion channel domain-containing protein [Blastocatellia bacterium]
MDWNDVVRLKASLFEHAEGAVYAILSLALGLILARILRRWLNAILNRSRIRDDSLLRSFFIRVLNGTILALAAVVALSHLGFQVASFVAGLGITGLVLGFGLRDTLNNFAAGLLLLIYRPFRSGQLIEVEGTQGVVEELTIVNMQMTTVDGVRVIMPNSKVWGAKIVNFSMASRRRHELTLNVPTNRVESAITALNNGISRDSRILKDPAPLIRVSSLGADSASLTIWLWSTSEDFGVVNADAYHSLLTALNESRVPLA